MTKVNTPWITTYETFVPRIKETINIHHQKNENFPCCQKVRKELEILASDNCKLLISLSKCNHFMQLELLKQYPDLYDKISPKMLQMNPPQDALIDNYMEKSLPLDYIQFMFVGNDFVRKGGVEIVRAFYEINKRGLYPLKLILVTDLNRRENYVFKENQLTKKEYEDIENIINSSPWIEVYSNLSNDKVISLMKNSHVGLFPTWGDTYGYSILEFQAAGCPVITTDIRAIPEINSDIYGWIIKLNKNKYGELAISSQCEKTMISQKIVDDLVVIIENILKNPNMIEEKGILSLNRIREAHNPNDYSSKLEQIYKKYFL